MKSLTMFLSLIALVMLVSCSKQREGIFSLRDTSDSKNLKITKSTIITNSQQGYNTLMFNSADISYSGNSILFIKSLLTNSNYNVIALTYNGTIALGNDYLEIPEGKTLVGNRSTTLSFNIASSAAIRLNNNSRLSGFNLININNTNESVGVTLDSWSTTIYSYIEYCSVLNFRHTGMGIQNGSIHHCYCDGANQYGYGYSILVGNMNPTNENIALIYNNYFDDFRHAIASNGRNQCSYNVYNNVFGPTKLSHAVDMHGEYHHILNSTAIYAGGTMDIHNNYFEYSSNYSHVNIRVRGLPHNYCRIHSNVFEMPSVYDSKFVFRQSYDYNATYNHDWLNARPPFGNVMLENNTYANGVNSDFVYVLWQSNNDNTPMPIANIWNDRSFSNIEFQRFLEDSAVMLDADGTNWETLTFERDISGCMMGNRSDNYNWYNSKNTNLSRQSLKYGYINSDEQMDVIVINYNNVYVSYANTSTVTWNGRSIPYPTFSSLYYCIEGNSMNINSIDDIAISDFNGDGLSDLFTQDNGSWYVALNNNGSFSNWSWFGGSGIDVSNLGFGDFNGDGATDILSQWNDKWHVSLTNMNTVRSTGWYDFGLSGITPANLVFGDVNHDGRDDIIRTDGSYVYTSNTNSNNPPYSTAWNQLYSGDINEINNINKVQVIDLDGNGNDDILIYQVN